MSTLRRAAVAVLATAALALTGCASTPAADPAEPVAVVAVTDAYGSIAEAIGGEHVAVTSIISGPAQDPHDYEATARDQLVVSRAHLVIVNGGGYDDFMLRLLESSEATVIDASETSGLATGGVDRPTPTPTVTPGRAPTATPTTPPAATPEPDAPASTEDHADHTDHAHAIGFNEHVWYSFPAVERIAAAITTELVGLVPEAAEEIEANAAAFRAGLAELSRDAAALEEALGGGDVMSTELVAAHLLETVGLHDVTPRAFAIAIESGTGVSARILDEVVGRVAAGDIRLLIVNPQSMGPEAAVVREAAETAGVPVVEFTETLPPETDYLTWMASNLDALESALQ